jgi:hypothetical protein
MVQPKSRSVAFEEACARSFSITNIRGALPINSQINTLFSHSHLLVEGVSMPVK